MIRHALLRATTRRVPQRTFVTARQKRELNQEQIQGAAKPAAAAAPTAKVEPSASSAPPPAFATAASSSSGEASGGGASGGSGGDSGSNSTLFLGGAAVIGGIGAAAYFGYLPGMGNDAPKEEKAKAPKTSVAEKSEDDVKEDVKEVVEEVTNAVADAVESSTEKAAEKTEEVAEPETSEAPAPVPTGRVKDIWLPKGSTKQVSSEPVSPPTHPDDGHRVLMKPSKSSGSDESSPPSPTPTVVDRALKELQDDLSRESSVALSEAHRELAKMQSSLDVSDLDNMTMTQLKVRLVQLAKDLEERTRWEAVRLKEFMAMKEKEVSEEYLQLMKSQRIELENMMERRLREQNEKLTQEKQNDLLKKDEAVQSIVDHSLEIQAKQFEEEKQEFQKGVSEAASAKFETFYGEKLAEEKAAYANKMEQLVQQMSALAKKLATVELALQSSEKFTSGSVQAHRVSAAALALTDKLQTSQAAADQVAAFKSISGYNAVLKAAASTIPESVSTSGVPTLQELQTRFEDSVYPSCRRAAMVPEGFTGLEGQIIGSVVSTVKFPPSPGDAAPDGEQDSAEYVLVRARRHIQLGQLEAAVAELGKLKGQVSFVASDFSRSAGERVAVDKALKVIRLECALANESMSKLS